jgi:hypothetical protein
MRRARLASELKQFLWILMGTYQCIDTFDDGMKELLYVLRQYRCLCPCTPRPEQGERVKVLKGGFQMEPDRSALQNIKVGAQRAENVSSFDLGCGWEPAAFTGRCHYILRRCSTSRRPGRQRLLNRRILCIHSLTRCCDPGHTSSSIVIGKNSSKSKLFPWLAIAAIPHVSSRGSSFVELMKEGMN